MVHPSKKAAAIATAESQRQAAFLTRDLVAYTEAESKMAALEAMADEYTCLHCGQDCPADTPHVELLIAAMVVFDLAVPTMPNAEFIQLHMAGADTDGVEQQIPIPDAKPELAARERYDFGIQNVANGGLGRRIKICARCVKKLKIHPRDYIEMR